MRYDLYYVKHMSLALDWASPLSTVRSVRFGNSNAQLPASTNGGMLAVRAIR